jgi:hypothetical protein
MGHLYRKNYTKEPGNKSWIHYRLVWFMGNDKDVSIEVCSTPSFGWSLIIEGDEHAVGFHFWFILKFYITFTRIFPEWVYPKEYNQFADKEAKALWEERNKQHREVGRIEEKPTGASLEYYEVMNRHKKLKGRARTKDKGWIRTATREISLSFHNYHMWWNIWRDDSSWSSDVPKWRNGSIDFVKLLKGKHRFEREVKEDFFGEIEMPEGKYLCRIKKENFKKIYQRWWSKEWDKYSFEFGYFNDKNEWISTPVLHWGKGTQSYNCGMDGTFEISLSNEIKTLEEAKNKVLEALLQDRERYGDIDFSNVPGIVDGVVRENLIGHFEKK